MRKVKIPRARRVTDRKPTPDQLRYRKRRKQVDNYWKHENDLARGKW